MAKIKKSILSPLKSILSHFVNKMNNHNGKVLKRAMCCVVATIFLAGCQNSFKVKNLELDSKNNKNNQILVDNLKKIEYNNNKLKQNSYLFCEELKVRLISSEDDIYHHYLDLINKYYVCLNKNNNLNFNLVF